MSHERDKSNDTYTSDGGNYRHYYLDGDMNDYAERMEQIQRERMTTHRVRSTDERDVVGWTHEIEEVKEELDWQEVC